VSWERGKGESKKGQSPERTWGARGGLDAGSDMVLGESVGVGVRGIFRNHKRQVESVLHFIY